MKEKYSKNNQINSLNFNYFFPLFFFKFII